MRSTTSIGVISSANSPACCAGSAFWCDCERERVLRLAAHLPLLRHLLGRQAHAVGDADVLVALEDRGR